MYFFNLFLFLLHIFSLDVTFISVEDVKNVQVLKKIAVLVVRIIGGGGGGLKNGEIFGIILKIYSDTDSVDR